MIAKRLKDSRLKKRWSQKELSEMSEVSFEQISRYETGKSSPHAYIAAKLARALGVSPDYLHGLVDDEPLIDNQNEANDQELTLLVNKIKTTSFSKKDKLLLIGFLDLLFMRKAGEQLFSKTKLF